MQNHLDKHQRAYKEQRLATLRLHLERLRAECANIEEQSAKIEQDLGITITGAASLTQAARSTRVSSRQAPIHRCPDEVLLHIFYCYLANSHRLIRRLLLVCRRWNNLLMSTKRIWARVEIADGGHLFDFPNQKSLVPYVNACFERSYDLPLDVELDLEWFPSFYFYIFNSLYGSVEHWINFEGQLQLEAISGEIEQISEPFEYKFQRSRAFNSIFGVNSDRLARYGTLKLCLPEDEDILEDIYQRLANGLPRLTSFRPTNLLHLLHEAILSLPSLETLVLKDDVPFTTFNLTPMSLRHLEIFIRDSLSTLVSLSSFKMLRTLKIRIWAYLPPTKESPFSLHLPHLDQLFILGDSAALQHVGFQLPSLDLLVIQVGRDDINPSIKVCPRRIELRIDTNPFYWRSREKKTAIIRELLMLSGTTRSITLPNSVFSEMVEALTSCIEGGTISSLNEVIISFEDGSQTSFDPHNGMQLQGLIQKAGSFVTV